MPQVPNTLAFPLTREDWSFFWIFLFYFDFSNFVYRLRYSSIFLWSSVLTNILLVSWTVWGAAGWKVVDGADQRVSRGAVWVDGCSNVLVTTGLPLLINTNSTAFVGLSSFTQMECSCQARTFVDNSDVECQPGSCLNGGTCIQRDYGFVWGIYF